MLYDRRWEKVDAIGSVLLAAADIIERRGWCNDGPVGPRGEVCLLVAISDTMPGPWSHEKDRLREAVCAQLRRHIDHMAIIEWNETVCESKEEAIAMLREAAHGDR
jgi:hypothetical protein